MKVIKIAQVPPPTVQASVTVKEAIPMMGSRCGCGVAVVDGETLVGTLSRDDVMRRVIGEGLDVAATRVRDVMLPATTVLEDAEARDALKEMYGRGQCYLGVVDGNGALKGWLAICNLFQAREDDLEHQVHALASYLAADGPGG